MTLFRGCSGSPRSISTMSTGWPMRTAKAFLAEGGQLGPVLPIEEMRSKYLCYESDSDFDDKDLAPPSPPLTPKESNGGPDFAVPPLPTARGTVASRASVNHLNASQGPPDTTTSDVKRGGQDGSMPPRPTRTQSQSVVRKRRGRPAAGTASDR